MTFEIFYFFQVLAGHEGPVSSLAFSPSPTSTALASASWDRTVRLWNAIESGSDHETLTLSSDGEDWRGALMVHFSSHLTQVCFSSLGCGLQTGRRGGRCGNLGRSDNVLQCT